MFGPGKQKLVIKKYSEYLKSLLKKHVKEETGGNQIKFCIDVETLVVNFRPFPRE